MNYIEFISQAIAAVFAIAIAYHDAPAVLHFEHYGVDAKTMSRFHRYNVWIKFLFCLLAALATGPAIAAMIFTGLASALWIYLLFDIFLNLKRPGRGWSYLGSNDADGMFWLKLFGSSAGEIKAIVLAVLIISLNVIYLKYFQ